MSKQPVWARKPNHRKEVVATEKGWVVKETGEVLFAKRNLSSLLDSLENQKEEPITVAEAPKMIETFEDIAKISEVKEEDVAESIEPQEDQIEPETVEVPVVQDAPKKRGRKPKTL